MDLLQKAKATKKTTTKKVVDKDPMFEEEEEIINDVKEHGLDDLKKMIIKYMPDRKSKNEIQPVEIDNKISKLPSRQEIDAFIDRYKYVKSKIVDTSDYAEIQGRRFLKKSGWRKFINAFGISIELVSKEVYEAFGDKHAEVRVRALAPNGQAVEGLGLKSMNELYTKTLHNLIANAWTRAVNRAVSDLVAFGEVSAEEVYISSQDDDFDF